MDLNIPNVEELLILYEINSEFNPLQVIRIYLSRETMVPQWRVRRHHWEGVRIDGEGQSSTRSSASTLIAN